MASHGGYVLMIDQFVVCSNGVEREVMGDGAATAGRVGTSACRPTCPPLARGLGDGRRRMAPRFLVVYSVGRFLWFLFSPVFAVLAVFLLLIFGRT